MRRLLVLVLFAASVNAATFIVPDDRTLVDSSTAIVIATAGKSHGQWAAGGWIETVTAMRVDEAIKGPLHRGEAFEVAELGGVAGDAGYAVPGSPQYREGERLLLFLEENDRGAWAAKSMAIGAFAFAGDERGRELLVRDAAELNGWDIDGTPHRERHRLASAFLDYVRATARNEPAAVDYLVKDPAALASKKSATTLATATVNSYLIQSGGKGIRWSTFPSPVVFLVQGKQTGVPDGGLGALTRGLAAWTNDSGSSIVIASGGTTTITNGLAKSDGLNSVQFNDPNNEITGSFNGSGVLAIGGAWFGSSSHTFSGESFYTIGEADLVIQNGLFGAGLTGNGFDHVLAHELGHCLGFRHSNLTPDDSNLCTSDSSLSCSNSALMNSTVNFDADPTGAALQSWDREAAAAVYGSGGGGPVTPPCTPPSITAQPQSLDLPLNGSDVVLSVSATGTAPLSYQWYVGSKGNTAAPVPGGTPPQISVKPATTTSYWVRVSSNCPPSVDSSTATVTVNGCPAVLINSQSPSIAILQGHSTALSVSATTGGALQYQWFVGPSGNAGTPITGANGASISVKPAATTSYWLRATNSCGAFANSDTIVVTVLPCDAPAVIIQPAGGEAVVAGSFTLSAVVSGTQPITMQWYEGNAGDTSAPVPNATTSTVTVSPIMNARTFWLRATNECGEASSTAVTVTVVSNCAAPVITRQPRDVAVSSGGSALVTVTATGTSLEYRWYQGQIFDFTKPVGGSLPTLYVAGVTTPTPYWVRITNSCGSVNSTAATVAPAAPSRRRPSGH